MMPLKSQTMTAVSILALALAVGGCSSSGEKDDTVVVVEPEPEPTPQERCEGAGGRWNEDMTCTTAEELAAKEAARLAKIAADTEEAGAKEMAMAMQIPSAGLGGSDENGNPVETYSLAIESDGTTVEITDTGMAGGDDPKFMQELDLGDGRTMHARAMAADDDGNVVEEVVIVSHDRDAPTPVEFAKFLDMDGMTPQELDVSTDMDNDDPDTTYEALDVDHTDTDVPALIMSPAFTAGGAGKLTFDMNDSSTPDEDEAFETAGTYNGAPGTYRCHGTSDCTVTLDAMGEVTNVGDGWIFTPDEGATSSQPDYDYLHYGVWLKRSTDKDGAVTYDEVAAFSGSSMGASDTAELKDVEGRARYLGSATGVYVKNVYASDGTIDTATSGDFKADVSLMAHFGGDGIPADMHNTVTGLIDSFMLSGGEMNDWAVALDGMRDSGRNTISGMVDTDDDGVHDDGAFSGTYHGATPMNEATTDNAADRVAPGSVVGEFNASFSDGEVLGGFGARKDR